MASTRCKHSSLTHYMTHGGGPRAVAQILTKCDVSKRVGRLPPQLVPLVPVQNRANIMHAFCVCLEKFFVNNIEKIKELSADSVFEADDISALFNLKCNIVARGTNVFGCCSWSGGFGVVCKLSFPAIKAEYALKYFLCVPKGKNVVHGPGFEIPTAFAAGHFEPKDNCPVYMASFVPGRQFMLSKWANEGTCEGFRKNTNEMFVTSPEEKLLRNWRNGQRIDFGDTHKTLYGEASYPVRKMYRQIKNAIENSDSATIEHLHDGAHTEQQRKNWCSAMRLISSVMRTDGKNANNVFAKKCIQQYRQYLS